MIKNLTVNEQKMFETFNKSTEHTNALIKNKSTRVDESAVGIRRKKSIS